jgi:hypothetical protein
MSDQLDKLQDQYNNDDEKLLATLNILVDKNGIMEYNCDWDGSEDGITAVASIFYKIMFDGLSESILAQIKEQCVLECKEETYMSIINLIGALAVDNTVDGVDDEVVVQPDQVFHL